MNTDRQTPIFGKIYSLKAMNRSPVFIYKDLLDALRAYAAQHAFTMTEAIDRMIKMSLKYLVDIDIKEEWKK